MGLVIWGCNDREEPSSIGDGDMRIPTDAVTDAAPTAQDRAVPTPDATPIKEPRMDASIVSDAMVILDTGVPDAGLAPDAIVVDGVADLELLRQELMDDVWIDERLITEDSCVLREGCVRGPGLRRLLRCSVATAHVGTADLFMGRPQANEELFVYSGCHEHFHFESYANYQLSQNGVEAA